MSNDKPATKQPSRPEAVAIRLLRFDGVTDIPGHQVSGVSLNGRNPTGDTKTDHDKTAVHDIEYQPWLRRFRVDYRNPSGEKCRPVFVLESKVRSYEEW